MKDFFSNLTGQLSIQKLWEVLVMMLVVWAIVETFKPGATELIIQDAMQHQQAQ